MPLPTRISTWMFQTLIISKSQVEFIPPSVEGLVNIPQILAQDFLPVQYSFPLPFPSQRAYSSMLVMFVGISVSLLKMSHYFVHAFN